MSFVASKATNNSAAQIERQKEKYGWELMPDDWNQEIQKDFKKRGRQKK